MKAGDEGAWFLLVSGRPIGEPVAFHDVDISLPLKREIAGTKVPLAALVRGVNTKSVEEIHTIVRACAE